MFVPLIVIPHALPMQKTLGDTEGKFRHKDTQVDRQTDRRIGRQTGPRPPNTGEGVMIRCGNHLLTHLHYNDEGIMMMIRIMPIYIFFFLESEHLYNIR